MLDWELSTLGDPLADLGTTMAYWHDDGDAERYEIPVAAGITAWTGFTSAPGFAELYSRASGRACTPGTSLARQAAPGTRPPARRCRSSWPAACGSCRRRGSPAR